MPSEVFTFSCNEQLATRLNEARAEGKSISTVVSDALDLFFKFTDTIKESRRSFVFRMGYITVTLNFTIDGEMAPTNIEPQRKK